MSRRQHIIDLNKRLVACRVCDALYARPDLAEGERARCGVCGQTLLTHKRRHAERTLALMIASVIVYLVAVSYPFMSMARAGIYNQISVIDAVTVLWQNGMYPLAIVAGALILCFPLMRAVLMAALASAMYLQKPGGGWFARVARLAQVLEPWSMVDIFMIGVIVSLVKVGELVDISLGAAFWGMTALVIFLTMGATAACRDSTWRYIREGR
ncbi:MAG: paraquat-inducible protein A [Pseudomonadota bacterium]